MPGHMSAELNALLEEIADLELDLRLTKQGGLSVSPKSRVSKSLAKRIKKHKQGIIGMILQVSDAWDVFVCAACLKQIPESEPQITIEDPDTEKRRHYHVDKECQEWAGRRIADSAGKGELHLIHLVHSCTCNDAEFRYNCKGGCFR